MPQPTQVSLLNDEERGQRDYLIPQQQQEEDEGEKEKRNHENTKQHCDVDGISPPSALHDDVVSLTYSPAGVSSLDGGGRNSGYKRGSARATAAKSKPDKTTRRRKRYEVEEEEKMDESRITAKDTRRTASSPPSLMMSANGNSSTGGSSSSGSSGSSNDHRSNVSSSSSSSPAAAAAACCSICRKSDHTNATTNTGFMNNNKNRIHHKGRELSSSSSDYQQQQQQRSALPLLSCSNYIIASSLSCKCGLCGLDDMSGSLMIYRSDLPGQFVHMRCALFLKPDRLRDDAQASNDKLQIIGNLRKIGRRRQCLMCSKPGAVRCGHPGCTVRYHPSCLDRAIAAGETNDTYKRIMRGPGMKQAVSCAIVDENFERMTKCGHTYLRIFCSQHKDKLCICGKRVEDGEETVDCRLKDDGCVYGTLHKGCMDIRRDLHEGDDDDDSCSSSKDGFCPHCEFCISSSGKLPGGPCCSTCIFCVYAYRDRTISSDEESGGEELGLYDADAHAAVLPKYRPDNNNRMDSCQGGVVAKKRRRNHKKETEAERSSTIMGCNPTHVASIDTTKKAIIPDHTRMLASTTTDDETTDNIKSSPVYHQPTAVVTSSASVPAAASAGGGGVTLPLESLVRKCAGEDLAPWLLIDVLSRNGVESLTDLKMFLSSSRCAFMIPQPLRNELRYGCSTVINLCNNDEDDDL
ncbi:hypothetical protein FOZ63_033295 [Perkinsus olseni]|uniref:PHD-type domain-containing protein n=1 Tax=Perkinsus olseni TaxID=32597 RepID=A0A7J6Q455_PEROL|nr:hypothetical protein FOZ63_033295 [Perkinsus olseni]